MKPQDFEAELVKTLTDQRLSRAEKRGLEQLVAGADPATLAVYRSIAFKLAARELAADKKTRHILDWLEEVVKALLPSDDDAPPSSQAFFTPGDEPVRKIVGLLASASVSADICVFTITDNRIADAILAAHERGIAVRIISDNDKAFDRGSDIHRLQDAGLKVRVDFTEHHMHHKFAIFDRKLLLTGSYNWTRSAAHHNFENFIVTADVHLLSPFIDHFDALWAELER